METKQEQNLFYNKEMNTYYYNNLNKRCDSCEEKIHNIIFIKLGFNGIATNKKYYCASCFKDKISFSIFNVSEEVKLAVIVENIPPNSILILDTPPDVSTSKNFDNFYMADHNREGEKVVDKTTYAGRDSLEGATIGDPKFIDNSVTDKILSQKEINKELEQIKKAICLEVTNEKEKKQLVNLGGLSTDRQRNRTIKKKVKCKKQNKKQNKKPK